LPGPWHDDSPIDTAATSIEFGELEDEPAATEVSSEQEGESTDIFTIGSDTVFEFASEEFNSELPPAEPPTPEVPTVSQPRVKPAVVEALASVTDPFGDGFDEEEVVINQAVIQSAEIFANRTRVASREGRELAASLLPQVKEPLALDPKPVSCHLETSHECETESGPAEDELVEAGPAHVEIEPSQDDWLSQAAFGAQMFEYTAFEPNSAANLALEALCDVNIALGDLESDFDAPEEPTVKLMDHLSGSSDEEEDDRDIILVENDAPTHPSSTPEGSVHRVEYQTLFSQLRHG
jgi:hypothetical protein